MFLSGHASATLIRTIENWGEGKWENFYANKRAENGKWRKNN